MLKELFDAISDQATQAAALEIVHPEAEPDHVYLVHNRDGKVELHSASPAPRNHRASDLETLVAWAFGQDDAQVWYNRDAVILLLEDDTRRDCVTLELQPSPQVRRLKFLESNQDLYDQKTFIRLLRIDFAGCLPPTLLQSVRQVKFSLLKGLEGEIGHGKESIGKSIQAELKGANSVPELVILEVPIWTGPVVKKRQPIPCAVEIDPIGEKFQLIPFPGEIEDAICRAEAHLGARLTEMLAEAGCSLQPNYGTP